MGVLGVSERKSFRILCNLMLILPFDNAPILLLHSGHLFILFLLATLLLLDLLPLVGQVDLVVVLWLDARLVPDVVAFDLLFLVFVEDRPFEMRQWFQLFVEFPVGTLGELRVVTGLTLRVIVSLVVRDHFSSVLAEARAQLTVLLAASDLLRLSAI